MEIRSGWHDVISVVLTYAPFLNFFDVLFFAQSLIIMSENSTFWCVCWVGLRCAQSAGNTQEEN